MPNFCRNNLTIWGNQEELAEFKAYSLVVADHDSPNEFDFTFEGLYPTPEELVNRTYPTQKENDESEEDYKKTIARLIEDYGYSNWYEWRIHNWGTKWDASESYISEDNINELYISFDTAWNPPTQWLKKVSLKFPNLNFIMDYIEEGVGFCGVIKIGDGEIKEEEGSPVYYDENENEVHNVDGVWYNTRSKEIIDRYDFYPHAENPFLN